jgi:hypothetical protein
MRLSADANMRPTTQWSGRPTVQAKFLCVAAEDAAQWGERLKGAGNYRIVEVEFFASVAENLLRWEKLDGIGPARYGELHQLQDAVVRLWRS